MGIALITADQGTIRWNEPQRLIQVIGLSHVAKRDVRPQVRGFSVSAPFAETLWVHPRSGSGKPITLEREMKPQMDADSRR